MFFAFSFVFTRIAQILTLIPTMGMLAWFVNVFVSRNALTPDAILILFVTSVLALAWAVFTLFSYHRSSANARFVALVDLAILATLVAAVVLLRTVADADCRPAAGPAAAWAARLGLGFGFGFALPDPPDKPCAMLKACWAFAIINIVLFFVSALAAFNHGDQLSAAAVGYYPDRRSRHHHHHHRSRHSSAHGHHHHGSHRHRSRSGHSSHRSSHSHSRRVYV